MTLSATIRLRRGAAAIDASIDAAPAETVALVGPNGAGKTTIARAIAGLDPIDAGRIAFAGQPWDDPASGIFVPSARRRVGMVFQDRLLFPHLSLIDNIAFGLHGRSGARAAARDWLRRIGLAGRDAERPDSLSGGQAALVALARALAPAPHLLLLDEPFAALDAETKAAMRHTVREHLCAHTGPALLITHDPLDAFALADRIAVLEHGRIAQQGTPSEIRERPASRFVAELVGVNWFRGRAGQDSIVTDGAAITAPHDLPPGSDAIAVISPRAVSLHATRPEGSPRNVFAATVADLIHARDVVRIRLEGPLPLIAEITPSAAAALHLTAGSPVFAAVKATEVTVFRV